MKFEEEAESLFGKMRELTKEESRNMDRYMKSISIPTGYNLFKIIEEDNEKGAING